MAEVEVCAKLGEPAATPNPVAENRIDDRRHEQDEIDKRSKLPPLGHRPGRNRGGDVREQSLREKQGEHAPIDHLGGQKELGEAEQAELVAEERDRDLAIRESVTADRSAAADSAVHQRKADGKESQHAQGIDHQVHRHRVGDVLRASQARFDHREASLHRDHEKSRDEHPEHIDREPIDGRRIQRDGGVGLLVGITIARSADRRRRRPPSRPEQAAARNAGRRLERARGGSRTASREVASRQVNSNRSPDVPSRWPRLL